MYNRGKGWFVYTGVYKTDLNIWEFAIDFKINLSADTHSFHRFQEFSFFIYFLVHSPLSKLPKIISLTCSRKDGVHSRNTGFLFFFYFIRHVYKWLCHKFNSVWKVTSCKRIKCLYSPQTGHFWPVPLRSWSSDCIQQLKS